MEKNKIINKPIYKYKPISYYSNESNKSSESEEDEEGFSYVMDEEKLNKLKSLKEKGHKSLKEKEENEYKIKDNIKTKKKSTKKIKKNSDKNLTDKKEDNSKRNSLIDLNNNIINNENKTADKNIPKSKSVYSLNEPDYFGFENKINNFMLDSKEKKEKILTNKKSKKKIKKIITKKKTINNKNTDINEVKKNEIFSEEYYKNKIKYIIIIQSIWKSYKLKIKLRLLKLAKIFIDFIKRKKIDYIKNFFNNLKEIERERINTIISNNKKINELLKKEKNYDLLNIKYEEVLKELNEIKNKIAFKQNLNMINNKNQNISINIFPTKENRRKHHLIIDNKNKLQILKEKNNISIKTICNASNIFYFLENIRKINLKYYYQKFMFHMTKILFNKIKKSKNKKNNNNDLNIINKTKSFSFLNKNSDNIIMKSNKNYIISNEISDSIISSKFNSNISNYYITKLENIKKNILYISDKNEIIIKKEKSRKNIKKRDLNYIINKCKNFGIIKEESFIENCIINYLKKKKIFFEKIKKIFNLKVNSFNEKELFINKIFEQKFIKKGKIENIICKFKANNFTINKKYKKLQKNYIIKKFQVLINPSGIKSKDLIITKDIKDFMIKGIDYSDETIDVILFISNTYQLTINSMNKKENKNNFEINKVINDYILGINKEKKKYIFEDNKLIINKIVKHMKFNNIKKDDFIINKLSSNNISIIKNNNLNEKNIITKVNKFYFKGKSKINNNLIINRNNNFIYNTKSDIVLNKKDDNLISNRIINPAYYKQDNLIITKTTNEFFMKIKRKKKLKKKKIKRFKLEYLFISDYNQLYIKRTKPQNDNYKVDINIEK